MSLKKILFISITGIVLLFSQIKTIHADTFNGITAWNGEAVNWPSGDVDGNTYSGVDIDGKVGYPLTVYNPTATCKNSSGQTSEWTLAPSIASGTLPPGMTLGAPPFQITGIPTERGHWIVTMSSGPMTCNGGSFHGFTQVLRFHITGSGQVVE